METEVCDRLLDDSSVEFQKIESMMQDQCLSDINKIGHSIDTVNRLKERRSWRRVNLDDIPIRGFHSSVIHEDPIESEVAGEIRPDPPSDDKNETFPLKDSSCNQLEVRAEMPADSSSISLTTLPCDLILRVLALLSPRERFLLCAVSKLLNALFCEPALWRHINLTSCSARVTDAAVETMLAITDHLESLVIRPIAPPPFLSWRFLQALAAHPCARSLSVLIVHNCEGLLCNTPRCLCS
jgi:hypothetical protein